MVRQSLINRRHAANLIQLFSSLYSMLPSAKKSLLDGNFSPKAAAWTLIGCFLGGALGIQLVSRILHKYMPTHVVDCEHNHDEEGGKEGVEESHSHEEHDHGSHEHGHNEHQHRPVQNRHSSTRHFQRPRLGSVSKSTSLAPTSQTEHDRLAVSGPSRRPSLHARLSQTLSNITKKTSCDCDGPCYGFSEPCGSDCFKNVQARGSFRLSSSRTLKRSASRSIPKLDDEMMESTPLLKDVRGGSAVEDDHLSDSEVEVMRSVPDLIVEEEEQEDSKTSTLVDSSKNNNKSKSSVDRSSQSEEAEEEHHHADHHHHVPENAFLSIGLQTSIAIALHKLPEGFITYATNHANPKLGFSVFLALFIHNITEGFALALPLYLALNSRPKAMFWSFILGGCSQPLGAGVAAIWFKIAGNGSMAPGEGVYGAMFAITAGIMASVALQLFSESMDLTHNRGLCMIFAFIGMGILGVSSALTA